MVININNENIKKNVLWILSYISEGDDDQITEILQMEVLPIVIDILKTARNPDIGGPALRIIGNVVSGYEEDTEVKKYIFYIIYGMNRVRESQSFCSS